MQDPNTVTLLVVEDDETDVEAFRRACRKARIANPIVVARHGEQALQILRGEAEAKVHKPYIILLDLNMPVMNGIEFLEEIRRDSQLDESIVFVFTTSDYDRDLTAAYKKNVAGYLLKSKAGDDFVNLLSLMDCYWRYVELPSR